MPSVTARWMADGKTSLDDWDALTWSLGCTGEPSFSVAIDAMTSLAFMLDEVPEPVWNTSIGNSSSHLPSATSAAASTMAAATRLSTAGTSLRVALTAAASPLIWASARISRGSIVKPEIGKFSTARWVWAPYRASIGTFTSPIESCSVRNAGWGVGAELVMAPNLAPGPILPQQPPALAER